MKKLSIITMMIVLGSQFVMLNQASAHSYQEHMQELGQTGGYVPYMYRNDTDKHYYSRSGEQFSLRYITNNLDNNKNTEYWKTHGMDHDHTMTGQHGKDNVVMTTKINYHEKLLVVAQSNEFRGENTGLLLRMLVDKIEGFGQSVQKQMLERLVEKLTQPGAVIFEEFGISPTDMSNAVASVLDHSAPIYIPEPKAEEEEEDEFAALFETLLGDEEEHSAGSEPVGTTQTVEKGVDVSGFESTVTELIASYNNYESVDDMVAKFGSTDADYQVNLINALNDMVDATDILNGSKKVAAKMTGEGMYSIVYETETFDFDTSYVGAQFDIVMEGSTASIVDVQGLTTSEIYSAKSEENGYSAL